MKTNRPTLGILILILLSLACSTLGVPAAATEAPMTVVNSPTAFNVTQTDQPTATDAPTLPPSPTFTSTPLPNPGTEELKKINTMILDGGWMEYVGNSMMEAGHKEKPNTTHYTEGSRNLVIFAKDDTTYVWWGDRYQAFTLPVGAYYYRYLLPSTLDLGEAMEELAYAAKDDDHVVFMATIYGMDVLPPQNMTVTFDYNHGGEPPANTFFPARDYTRLSEGQKIEFDGASLVTFRCQGSNTWSHVIVWLEYTSVCPQEEALRINVYFVTPGTETAREGTDEENYRLARYLMWKSGQLEAERSNRVERFIWLEGGWLDWHDLADFDDLHSVAPTATSTPLATATRTGRPTFTPTAIKTATATPTPTE